MKKNQTMLIEHLKAGGITNKQLLNAIGTVPREQFVSPDFTAYAYEDEALPIKHGQTISQPFIVARMTELILKPGFTNNVLEIGTGSGYQAAILSQLFDQVYTIERIKPLLEQAQTRFEALHYLNIHTRFSDGFAGWPEAAPFDAIIVTAAASQLPAHLVEQLKDGGQMIIPIGNSNATQWLQRITHRGDELEIETLDPVVFVPLLAGKQE